MKSFPVLVVLAALFTSAAYSQTFSNIDNASGWQSCGSCAGSGGSGPNTPRSLSLSQLSPSLDGSSAKFSIFPTRSFSNALWWKQLGGTSAYHFKYDFYVYIKTPSVSQALEFDVNQASGGRRHIFGTECDMQGAHAWRVYGNGTWNSTGIRCSLNSYAWNHITWEFNRLNGRTNFVAVTVNGAKHYVNRSYYANSSSSNELNVAVQLDGIGTPTSYSIWTDKMSLAAF